jgi:uncharacterized protein
MKLKISVFILVLLTFLSACQRSDVNEPMNPDMARSMIRLKGYTADEAGFFQAVKNNDVVILKAFFDAGVNPNGFNENGETPLTLAVQSAESKTVKAMLDKVNINQQDKKGNSPIHLALLKNKDDIFNALLERGADVNVAGRSGKVEGQTVLYLAVVRGREDLVENLLTKGANPNLADSGGATPLTEACIGSNVNANIVKMLLDKGANPNLPENLSGAHSLIWIASNKETSSANRQEVVKMLLDKGANKSLKDKKGRTALDWAKQAGNKDVAELLIH